MFAFKDRAWRIKSQFLPLEKFRATHNRSQKFSCWTRVAEEYISLLSSPDSMASIRWPQKIVIHPCRGLVSSHDHPSFDGSKQIPIFVICAVLWVSVHTYRQPFYQSSPYSLNTFSSITYSSEPLRQFDRRLSNIWKT